MNNNNFSILWGPPYGLMARLPPLNWLVHSVNVPFPNTKCSDGGQDYDSWPGPLDPKLEASKAASKFNTKLSTCVTVQLPPVAEHVSDEPLKCGQMPPPPPLKKYQRCFPRIVQIWGFVDGKCKGFGINPCGYKIPGFASEEECQKGCGPKKIELKKGQDYGWAPVGRLGWVSERLWRSRLPGPPMAVWTEAIPVSN